MVLIFILIYFEWRDTENQQLVFLLLQYPQKAKSEKKMRDSEPRAVKSSVKWVKSREISQISQWRDLEGDYGYSRKHNAQLSF